jgi:hypothetical protein
MPLKPGTPIFTSLGRIWLAVRWALGKLGARGLEVTMKRIEVSHERGIPRNLRLAQEKGWNQILRRHGRALPDLYLHSPTYSGLVAT